MPSVSIPHRAVFRAQDVCEIAQVQPYVLRSWEAEFPDLGVSKSADGPRIYRRADVELVLRLKDLLFVDGLTLAGARRRLLEEGATSAVPADQPDEITDEDVAEFLDKETRKSLIDVREGLGWILTVLDGGKERARARPAKAIRSKAAKGKSSRSTRASRPRPTKRKASRAPRKRR